MSRKTSLSTQTGKLNIVIRKNREIDKGLITKFCNEFFSEWAFIVHEKDKEPLTGIIEGIHYHIVANAKDKNKRLATWLNVIVDYFKFKDSNGIEIDKYQSLEGSLQYLIHKNDPDKTQHKFEEVVYKWNEDDIKLFMCTEYNNMTLSRLEALCKQFDSIIEVYRQIPFEWCYNAGKRGLVKEIFDIYHKVGY